MKNVARLAGAALMALTASTAQATGEARVEVVGGIAWASANGITASDEFLGMAAGYDFDIGGDVFIGPEVSAYKALVDGADIAFNVGGRAGAKFDNATRVYITGGLSFDEGETYPYTGFGLQHKFGSSIYGKIEYRHSFDVFAGIDGNAVGVGFGLTF